MITSQKKKRRLKTNTPKNIIKQRGKSEEIDQKNGQGWKWIGNREMGLLLWLIQCYLPDLQAVVWADGCNGQAVKWVILDPVWQQSEWGDEEHQRQHIKRQIAHKDATNIFTWGAHALFAFCTRILNIQRQLRRNCWALSGLLFKYRSLKVH